MTPLRLCPHGVAVTICAVCIGLQLGEPHLKTHPEAAAEVFRISQPIPEPDPPSEQAGESLAPDPIKSLVSATSIRPTDQDYAYFKIFRPKSK